MARLRVLDDTVDGGQLTVEARDFTEVIPIDEVTVRSNTATSITLDTPGDADVVVRGSFTGSGSLAAIEGPVTAFGDIRDGIALFELDQIDTSVAALRQGFVYGDFFSGNDSFIGGARMDQVIGGGGDDSFSGGGGIDRFTLSGSFSEYQLSREGNVLVIADPVIGRDGTDRLDGVEIVAFSDNIAAAMLPADSASIARLYGAAFGRQPDVGGLEYWLDVFAQGGAKVEIASAFLNSAEFQQRYGPLENVEYIRELYSNVLGREGDQGGIDYWTGILDNQDDNRTGVLINFADSPENQTRTADWLFEV